MSDDGVGRYRRAYPKIWRDPRFTSLNSNKQRIALYVLLGPQMNRIGLSHFSVATAAEDLGLGLDTFREGLSDVCLTFGWFLDAKARVIYVPSWWRWNRPDNVNVLRGNLKDISELPPCALVEAFAVNLAYVPPDLHETFIETLRLRLPERSGTQEQEQSKIPSRAVTRAPRPEGVKQVASSSQPRSEQLVAAARETLKMTSPNRPLEELVDAFQFHLRTTSAGLDCSARAAREAISEALAERRQVS